MLAHVSVLGRRWEVHTLIGGSLLLIVGAQVVTLGLCARAYGIYFMGERDPWFERMRRRWRLEHGLLLGSAIASVGLAIIVAIVLEWVRRGFGSLSEERLAILAATLLVLGIQVVFASFLLSHPRTAAPLMRITLGARRRVGADRGRARRETGRMRRSVVARTRPPVPPEKQLVDTTHAIGGCQKGELLPRDTVAIRLGLFAVTTPEVAVKVFAGPRAAVTEGTLAPGWSGEGATVPVRGLPARCRRSRSASDWNP